MSDFAYTCEKLVRKIFQCDESEDPLGRLSTADYWVYTDNEFDIEFKCRSWAVISRLQNEYLDSFAGREELYEKSVNIEERILASNVNRELKDLMLEIKTISDRLELSEFPRINYQNTNDLKKKTINL